MYRCFILLIMSFGLFACGSNPPLVTNPYVQVAEAGALPAPMLSDTLAANRLYLIGPFDRLDISVFGVPELQQEIQVDANGQLSFPLIGLVDAAGTTPTQLSADIASRLRGRFVKNPQVTVNLQSTVSQVVTMDGQVAKPGLYPVIGNMTLMRAIASAGGVSEFARLREIIVFRKVGNTQMAGVYNLDAIRKGAYQDPEIYANDVVVVGDSEARRTMKRIIEAAPLLTTPLILLTRI